MPRSHVSTFVRAFVETVSARALTRFMSILIGLSIAIPILGAAPGQVGRIGAGDQRLGRHAAGIDAGSAEQLALDERDFHAGRGQPSGEGRACLPGADDDGVEELVHATGPRDECRAEDRNGVLQSGGKPLFPECNQIRACHPKKNRRLPLHPGCRNTAGSTGSFRRRLPVAAKIALVTAGTMADVPASPMPPGGSELCTMWTSTAGASFMRSIW